MEGGRVMGEIIKYGQIQKPGEKSKGTSIEPIIRYGIGTPCSSFDRRPECGPAPAYVGPSKTEDRSSAIGAGKTQKKKHTSSGSGQ